MILQDEEEYMVALRMAEEFMDSDPVFGTPDSDIFNTIVDAIEVYEDKHYPMGDGLAGSLMVSEGCPNADV